MDTKYIDGPVDALLHTDTNSQHSVAWHGMSISYSFEDTRSTFSFDFTFQTKLLRTMT
jgi:hypothetical protein